MFEIETILSVEARGEIDWEEIEKNSKDLNSLANKPFDTEGIKVVASRELQKASVDPKYYLKQYDKKKN